MNPSYLLDLDIAKRNIRFHLADSTGQRRASGAVPATAAGLAHFFHRTKSCDGCSVV